MPWVINDNNNRLYLLAIIYIRAYTYTTIVGNSAKIIQR